MSRPRRRDDCIQREGTRHLTGWCRDKHHAGCYGQAFGNTCPCPCHEEKEEPA